MPSTFTVVCNPVALIIDYIFPRGTVIVLVNLGQLAYHVGVRLQYGLNEMERGSVKDRLGTCEQVENMVYVDIRMPTKMKTPKIRRLCVT